MNENKKVYVAAVFYAIITGLSFLFGKMGLSSANPIDLLAYRFTSAFFAILVSAPFMKTKPNYNINKILKILPLALLYPLFFFSFQTFGLQYATSSEAGILLASSPIFTLIMAAYFLKEKTNLKQKLSVILSVLGVIYITLSKSSDLDFNNMKGITLLLLSSLSISGYSVMARKLTKDFSGAELSYVMIIISFLSFNILSIGGHLVNGTIGSFLSPLKDMGFIVAILYLGVLSSLGTSLLINYMLSKIEASKMSVFFKFRHCNFNCSRHDIFKRGDIPISYYRLHMHCWRGYWDKLFRGEGSIKISSFFSLEGL